jgi:thioredoxin reductase
MDLNKQYDAIVIGGGPAGLTAGIYLSRARIKTLIINEGTVGGQLILTHEIANFQHQTKNKLILADFRASWCAPCIKA